MFVERFSDDIASVVDTLFDETRLALDTESDPFHRYFEKVCLIQLSTSSRDFVIDPLAVGMPDPIRRLLSERARTIVLHGADYDVRSLRRSFDLELGKVFDTLIAAQLLNKKHLGLKSLLELELGIAISKTEQRSDWGQRPLTQKQLEYARQDTAHLLDLADKLRAELDQRGRAAWLEEECELLRLRPFTERVFDPGGWRKLKGAQALGPLGKKTLEAAYLWRERRAEADDRPPFRVLRNEVLVQLARAVERAGRVDMAELRKARIVPRSIDSASLEATLAADVVPAPTDSADPLPSKNSGGPPAYAVDPEVKARLDRLKLARAQWAKALDLDPGFLVAQSVLERLARDPPTSTEALVEVRGMTQWRSVAIGHEILAVLKSS